MIPQFIWTMNDWFCCIFSELRMHRDVHISPIMYAEFLPSSQCSMQMRKGSYKSQGFFTPGEGGCSDRHYWWQHGFRIFWKQLIVTPLNLENVESKKVRKLKNQDLAFLKNIDPDAYLQQGDMQMTTKASQLKVIQRGQSPEKSRLWALKQTANYWYSHWT